MNPGIHLPMDRDTVVEFIKANDVQYSEVDLSSYTDEQLVIIKVRIELELERKRIGGTEY